MFNFYKKESPILGLFGLGGGISRFGSGLSKLIVEYLVIAGGGGGGGIGSGGGGAGGFRTGFIGINNGQLYPISIGGGGSYSSDPAQPTSPTYIQGRRGSNSTFGTITSTGGGGGGAYFTNSSFPQVTEGPGGSGSGKGCYDSIGTGNTPPVSPPQGNNGGGGDCWGHGGGGGAGGTGGTYTGPSGPDMPSFTSAIGGIGSVVTWPEIPASYGTSGPTPGRWFAAGGSGGGGIAGRVSPAPGQPVGGGGATGANGQTNTGSGGGGGNTTVGTFGGSGIVLIRIPTAYSYTAPGSSVFSSPTHRVLIYTGNGSITLTSV